MGKRNGEGVDGSTEGCRLKRGEGGVADQKTRRPEGAAGQCRVAVPGPMLKLKAEGLG